MPQPEFVLRIPDVCPGCNASGIPRLEQSIKGSVVQLTWSCRPCGHEWPVVLTHLDTVERRRRPDRRRTPRGEQPTS